MSRITCIIVEDEPLAIRVLTDYIVQVPFLELQGSFRDAIDATDYLQSHTVDLIFLDIHLPKLKGMAFLRTLANPPAVIVTTAYHEYAVEGFTLNVSDYLLKPFDFERFLTAVTKIRSAKGGSQNSGESDLRREFIFLNVQKKKVKILFSEVVYIESLREYIKVKTTKKEYISKMSTHEIEALLPAHLFKRIHRSFIVSVGKIESYTATTIQVDGVSIPVGKSYRSVVDRL